MKECELGMLFQDFICKNHGMGYNFDLLFEEVESIQGIPDYLGVQIKDLRECKNFLGTFSNDSWHSTSKILSCLSYRKGHTINYISNSTGMSENALEKFLGQLTKRNIILKDEKGKYMIAESIHIPQLSIISFELKLKNWKRALFQAIRYKMFSDYVYVVMPIEKKNLLEKNKELFITNNIGIALYDKEMENMQIMYRAKKNKNISKIHLNYMCGKILFEYQHEKHLSASTKII